MLCFLVISAIKGYGQDVNELFDAQAKPQLVSNQFTFTEGPAVDKKGNVFFTDESNNKIWKYDTDGKLSLFVDDSHRSNGMYFDKKGNLLTCADGKGELLSINPKGKIKVLISGFKGKQFNGPNDLWVNPKGGGIYFTDPYYQHTYWTRTKPDLDGEKLYYLAKGMKEPVIADANFKRPNGIVGTPDGKNLYVADIDDHKTYKYTINKNGTLSDRTLFVSQGSDGMTIDNKGNIYLTGGGVTVFSPEGKKIVNIPIPQMWTANVCFGGKNRDILFMTASTGIYILKMNVKGVQ